MGTSTQKPIVFISHIEEEKDIALALKVLVEEAFSGIVEVWVSSSPRNNKAGREWLKSVTEALQQCKLEIAIVSPLSIDERWINFEAGAVWGQDKPVIPLCHSGMTKSGLEHPLGILQARMATDEDDLKDILTQVAEQLGGDRVPPITYSAFIKTVKDFEQRTPVTKPELVAAVTTSDADDPLRKAELAILAGLAEADDPRHGLTMGFFVDATARHGVKRAIVIAAVQSLESKMLVEMYYRGYSFEMEAIRLTSLGWNWVAKSTILESSKAKQKNDSDE